MKFETINPSAQFMNCAREIEQQNPDLDWDQIWNKARVEHRDVFDRMVSADERRRAASSRKPAPQFANSDGRGHRDAYVVMPAYGTDNASTLGLNPAFSDENLFALAWRANGSAMTPLNAPAVFRAVVGWLMSKNKIAENAARQTALAQHPTLRNLVGVSTPL